MPKVPKIVVRAFSTNDSISNGRGALVKSQNDFVHLLDQRIKLST